jgi:hypothetical protein
MEVEGSICKIQHADREAEAKNGQDQCQKDPGGFGQPPER